MTVDAIAFLQKLRPGGPWILTAIEPDGAIETITAESAEHVTAFVDKYDGKRNLYYGVNPTRKALGKKASKTDIAAIEYALADLDPNADETSDAAKQRYLGQLNGGAFQPRPVAVVDSGNGIQGLWRLEERIELGAPVRSKDKLVFSPEDQAKIDDVEARVKAIMVALGAKPGTQNVDRILRLPGTTNLPNAKKRKEGRVACQTKLLWFDDASYPLEAFPPADRSKDTDAAGAAHVGAHELPPRVAAFLFIEGSGPYTSRSELLFSFLIAALQAQVSESAIAAACLDTAHAGCGIYQHVAGNGEGYIERQIQRARGKVKETRASEMMTDLGNARRLVRSWGLDLRYVHAWRAWLTWENGHWRKDDNGSVVRKAKATVEEMFIEAGRINDEARRTAARRHALRSQGAKQLSAMVSLAQSEIEVVLSVEKLDADPLLLGVRNGVIDLRTATFREARREDYVTKVAGVAFDAEARCPNWIAFLAKFFPDDADLIAYLQRAVGYLLTGLTSEEVLFVLWGAGNNGKSTFRETLFALLGEYAVGSDASLLVTTKRTGGATPDLARLHGKRIVTINETEQNDHLNEARVKFITNHDAITARNLYEAPFDFTPTHKTFLTTNHKPIVRGTDPGIWRRIHLLPFLVQITAEDRQPNFREKKLLPELPGILNWALTGLEAWQKGGLQPPKSVTDATLEYRTDMDLIGLWIEERCKENPASEMTTAELYQDYDNWAENEVGFKVSVIAFGRELASRPGLTAKKVGGHRGIAGLEVLSPEVVL
jgi:P4 family phage/plasmid primase-like protien